jgi:hypothetical protein
MAEHRRSSRLMPPKMPRFCPEMKTRARVLGVVPAVTLVDIAALDLAARKLLGILDDVTQGVTVIGITGQCLGMQHELTTRERGRWW